MTARQYTLRMMFASASVASAWIGGFLILSEVILK
jgi:hypothetical protein